MKQVTSQAIWQTFLTNLAIQVANVFTGVATARLLQPEGRGELAAVILWPSILAGLGILGTNWALTREVAAHPEKEADLAKTAVVLGVGQAAVCMALGYFLVPQVLPTDKQHLIPLTRFYLLWLPLNFVALNLIALDHGGLKWLRFNLFRLSMVIPYLLIILVLWLFQVTMMFWFITAIIVSNLITVIIRFCIHWRKICLGRTSWAESLHILKGGLPYFLATASSVIALQADKALMVSLLSSEAVGWYAAAFTFAAAHSSLGGALGVTSFAALANETDPVAQGDYLAKVFRQATLLYVAAGTAVALLAPLAIVPLFGPDFAPAVAPAAILALATSCSALAQVLNEGLRGRGTTYPGIAGQLIGGVAVAMAALVLVPYYGLNGLAFASIFGAAANLGLMIMTTLVLLKIQPAQLWGLHPLEIKLLFGRFRVLIQKTL